MPDLADVIASVESDGNLSAIRFERGEFERVMLGPFTPTHARIIDAIARVHHCSTETAAMIACTSWGKFQIMGLNLYNPASINLAATVFAFIANADLQINAFELYLTEIGYGGETWADLVAGDGLDFAALYNGPDNAASYWSLLQAAARKLDADRVA